MSTNILKNYEQQFGILCADITSKISKINENEDTIKIKIASATDYTQLQANIESLFQEARELIEQMELEIRDITSKQNFNNEQKQKYANIIKSYKTELSKLESEFKRRLNESRNKRDRHDLFDNDDDNSGSKRLNENNNDTGLVRKQQEINNEKVVKMNKTLENGYQITMESEEIGKNILNDLNQQREVIQRSRDRLRQTNNELGQSSRLLTTMTRRIMQNKFLIFGLFIFLFLFTLFVIYLVVRRRF